MLWLRELFVSDDNGRSQIEHMAALTGLLSRVSQLEEEYNKKVSNIDSSSSNIYRGKFELLVEWSLILDKQEDYDTTFTVVAKILHVSGCLEKLKELFAWL